jgi:hypothetical protein
MELFTFIGLIIAIMFLCFLLPCLIGISIKFISFDAFKTEDFVLMFAVSYVVISIIFSCLIANFVIKPNDFGYEKISKEEVIEETVEIDSEEIVDEK